MPAHESSGYLVAIASRLRAPEHRARFLELSSETEAWLRDQPGFLRYELVELDDGWMDTMLWSDASAADAGNRRFGSTPIAAAFAEIVEDDPLVHAGAITPLRRA